MLKQIKPRRGNTALVHSGQLMSQWLMALGGIALLWGTVNAWQLPMNAAPKPPANKLIRFKPPASANPPAQRKAVPAIPATPAPEAVVSLLKQLDEAASRKDLDATLKFYSPNFTHQDGLTYQTWKDALKTFWNDATTVRYQTQIESWQAKGPAQYVLETFTKIEGTQKNADRDMKLASTVRSRIAIIGGQITSQEILQEQTRLTAGTNPPVVQFNLPEQVNVGQTFNFDAIIKDPLGSNLLLGSAVEEPIRPDRYSLRKEVVLEPLSSGGLFKVGQAPSQPISQWISAVLVQEQGMTIVSQRLNVVKATPATRLAPSPR